MGTILYRHKIAFEEKDVIGSQDRISNNAITIHVSQKEARAVCRAGNPGPVFLDQIQLLLAVQCHVELQSSREPQQHAAIAQTNNSDKSFRKTRTNEMETEDASEGSPESNVESPASRHSHNRRVRTSQTATADDASSEDSEES